MRQEDLFNPGIFITSGSELLPDLKVVRTLYSEVRCEIGWQEGYNKPATINRRGCVALTSQSILL